MEGQDEKILVQERTYKPKNVDADTFGLDIDSVESADESNIEQTIPEFKQREINSVTNVLGDNIVGLLKKYGMLAAVAVMVVIVGVIVLVSNLGKAAEEKEEAVRQEHAEQLQEEIIDDATFFYTEEEKEQLRLAGYTGYDIESFEIMGEDVNTLVKAAALERQEQYEREIIPYFESASNEFKELCRDTWVGQPKLILDESSKNDWNYFTKTVNVDYEKIEPTGMQCFIKCEVLDTSIFLMVLPDRYLELPESGNMVLEITYVEMPNGSRVLTKANEIKY